MKEEKKLRDSLIRRFIGVLMIVGIVEYLLLTMSDKFVMPFMADVFFPDYEITGSFSSLAIGTYFFSTLINGIVGFIGSYIPIVARLPFTAALSSYLMNKENSFFATQEAGIIAGMPLRDKLLITLFIIIVLVILALPYVAGAVYFSLMTVREFNKIAEVRKNRAIEAEKKRNLMISDIAHDLRTPITTISGYAQALTDGLVKEEDKQSYLEAIRDKSAGMNDLIQLLFDYTRLDSKGFVLNRSTVDICEMVRECAASLYTDAEAAGMEMEVNIPEEAINEDIDRPQFTRVINNLMVNAVRHNKKGNTVGVFVFTDNNRTRIAIADKGEAIPDDKAGHLFEPFFMGDESRNSKGGSGLGLSVAKKITDMHGYSLELKQGSALKRYPLLKDYVKAFIIKL
ncbi:MAG: HAMP domain-containing histidine kinase [Lachnospiraceae bacterium]|nr:HAMP domain-containing histidine kinase [Lachnospiraceae bacterium]